MHSWVMGLQQALEFAAELVPQHYGCLRSCLLAPGLLRCKSPSRSAAFPPSLRSTPSPFPSTQHAQPKAARQSPISSSRQAAIQPGIGRHWRMQQQWGLCYPLAAAAVPPAGGSRRGGACAAYGPDRQQRQRTRLQQLLVVERIAPRSR